MKRVQRVRHTGAEAADFLGRSGELTVNLTNLSVIVHDGIRSGGYEQARADASNIQVATTAQDGKMTASQVQELNAATSGVSANASAIGALDSRVTTNEADIAANTAAVSANSAAIGDRMLLVPGATQNNIAAFDNAGQVVDGGVSKTVAGAIPLGSVMVFVQNTAPAKWTLSAAHNDRVLRCNSTGAGQGGTWTISGLSATGTVLTIAQLPRHRFQIIGGFATATQNVDGTSNPNANNGNGFTEYLGNDEPHVHGVASNGSWRPNYVDAIVCSFTG